MNKRKILTMVCSLAGLAWARSSGPDAGYSGAPIDNAPMACATSGCHTGNRQNGGPINFHGGGVSAVFSTGDVYYPGVPVVITVTVTDPVNRVFGFQMSARPEADQSKQAGRFEAPNRSMIVICQDNNERRPGSDCRAAAPVEFIEHAEPAAAPWQFTWTPTPNQTGPVHFYVAGNAVNGNTVEDAGDHVYTKDYVLNPAACAQVNPEITSINSGSDFGGLSSIAAGSWIEIKGNNLAGGTRVWEGRDFLYSLAPSSIDGVRVTINNRPATVFYVSPGQVNVQSPTDTINGSVAVILTNCGGTSPLFSVQKNARAPGLLAHPLWKVGGKQYLTALYGDGATFVGNPGLISGVPFRPAKPGDQITTYGIGFGDVTPTRVPLSGVVVPKQNTLASSFTFRIGGVDAVMSYSGLAPGFIGLYQFNFTVPDVPDGDLPVTGTLAGTALQQPAMFFTVKR